VAASPRPASPRSSPGPASDAPRFDAATASLRARDRDEVLRAGRGRSRTHAPFCPEVGGRAWASVPRPGPSSPSSALPLALPSSCFRMRISPASRLTSAPRQPEHLFAPEAGEGRGCDQRSVLPVRFPELRRAISLLLSTRMSRRSGDGRSPGSSRVIGVVGVRPRCTALLRMRPGSTCALLIV
jgi:hypothetical protein